MLQGRVSLSPPGLTVPNIRGGTNDSILFMLNLSSEIVRQLFHNQFYICRKWSKWFLLWITENFSRTIVYIFISLLSRNCMQTVTCDSDKELHLTSQSLLLYWLWSLTVVNWWVFYETFPAAQDQTVGGWDPGKQRNHNSHCHSVTLTNLKNIENDYTRKIK